MDFIHINGRSVAFTTGIVITTSLIIAISRYYRNQKSHHFQPIILCRSSDEWIKKEKDFIKKFYAAKFIGLDCEWVTLKEKRRPIALLQIATSDGLIVLLRLCNLQPGVIPSTLVELLANKNIIKVGVAICEDAGKLLHDYGLIVESCLDLRHLVKDKPEFQNEKRLGLQVLSKIILKADLKKSLSLTCSNWEAATLTPKQIAYAAEDAWAAAQILQKVLDPCYKKWFFSNIDYELKRFQPLFNIPFKRVASNVPNNTLKKQQKTLENYCSAYNIGKYSKCLVNKLRYDNCQLLAPDGEQLCACDAKKALWYVKKGRGDIVNESPLTVRLNFEPSGRPILDNKYYIQEKDNRCVVCGRTELLIRKFVVPSEYRKHFPELMKKCLSHDVLLLCAPCHRKCNLLSDALRQQLAVECNAPIGSEKGAELKANMQIVRVKSAARALLITNSKIPEQRQLELKQTLCDYYEVDSVTEDLIRAASELNCFLPNDEFMVHGYKVYEYVCKHGGLIAFESRWRKYFLDTMQPKFLPDMWSIDHNHERLVLQVLKKKADFDVSVLGISDELMNKVKNMNL